MFAQSTYELHFNLYPLKAGWQQLPEFELKYNMSGDIVMEKRAEELTNNLVLQKLVQRWMPKRVFVLVIILKFCLIGILRILAIISNLFMFYFQPMVRQF